MKNFFTKKIMDIKVMFLGYCLKEILELEKELAYYKSKNQLYSDLMEENFKSDEELEVLTHIQEKNSWTIINHSKRIEFLKSRYKKLAS